MYFRQTHRSAPRVLGMAYLQEYGGVEGRQGQPCLQPNLVNRQLKNIRVDSTVPLLQKAVWYPLVI